MGIFQIKPDIHYGTDSLDILKTLDIKKVFIVTDENMVKLYVVDKITEILSARGIKFEIYSDINPDPTDKEIIKGMIEFIAYSPDCIIGLGGGSPIDASKGILYFINKIQNVLGKIKKPKFIAIPTTSGTGSEVTSYSVVTSEGKKIPLSDVEMLPDIAILNPEFIKTLPPTIIADTGMDVLTHAIEAYVCKNGNLFAKTLALGAIKTVFEDLLNNYLDPTLEKERMNMLIASCMAGVAFSNSALGINHSIAHTLGAKFHKAHGRLNATIMPKVILFNAKDKEAAKLYSEIAKSLGFAPKSDEEGVQLLVKAIEIRKNQMSVPIRLKDLGIPEIEFYNYIEAMIDQIDKDMCTEFNPRKYTREEMKQLLIDLY